VPEILKIGPHTGFDRFRRSDMLTFLKYMEKRWPIEADTKQRVIAAAMAAMSDPELLRKLKPRDFKNYAKILLEAERQNQMDEHLQAEYDRLDAGQLTANQGHTLILDGPIRPQVIAAASASLPSNVSQPPQLPRVEGRVIPDGTQPQLPPPSAKDGSCPPSSTP
jgi:hypothetical protein